MSYFASQPIRKSKNNRGTPLNDYLDKILRGQPINYEAFLKKLPEQFRRRHRDMFATEKVQSNRWLVTVRDETAFAELQNVAEAPLNRVDAARKGDSHRQPPQGFEPRLRDSKSLVITTTLWRLKSNARPSNHTVYISYA